MLNVVLSFLVVVDLLFKSVLSKIHFILREFLRNFKSCFIFLVTSGLFGLCLMINESATLCSVPSFGDLSHAVVNVIALSVPFEIRCFG